MYDPIERYDNVSKVNDSVNCVISEIDDVLPISMYHMCNIFGDNLVMDFFIERRLDNYTHIENV